MPQVTNLLTRFIEQLSREWACTYTSAISLHDTIYITNLIGTDTQTCAGSRTDRIRGGDKWIAAEVHIEHGALSTFAKNAFTTLQNTIDLVFRIDNRELTQVLNTFKPLLLNLCNVIFEMAFAFPYFSSKFSSMSPTLRPLRLTLSV